jgi:UDP-galactopyranose mutase
MNYADPDIPFTRIHEFKHFHPERKPLAGTTIYREFAKGVSKNDDPYYPIHTNRDKKILSLYQKLTEQTPGVIFGGRLGSYAYLDMDQTIQQALHLFQTKIKNQ